MGVASARPEYRYVVSWDFWDDSYDNRDLWNQMDVRLNGKSIGERETAFKKLEELPIEKGEHVKLEMPTDPRSGSRRPGHWVSNFVQRWMEKGALVDWYEGGKKIELHTVT
jgi:hypothetical protein